MKPQPSLLRRFSKKWSHLVWMRQGKHSAWEWSKKTKTKKDSLAHQKHLAARLKSDKIHVDVPQSIFCNILLTDENKFNNLAIWMFLMFGGRKEKSTIPCKNTIPTLKHVGGNLMFWRFFSTSGPGSLVKMNGTLN